MTNVLTLFYKQNYMTFYNNQNVFVILFLIFSMIIINMLNIINIRGYLIPKSGHSIYAHATKLF